MSRVRIYELASEAGFKSSKDLADRLMELGYPIRGHSSTVDDDMAAAIRREIIPQMVAELAGKKLEIEHPPADDASPEAQVRRRPKTRIRVRQDEDAEELSVEDEGMDEEEDAAAPPSEAPPPAIVPETAEDTPAPQAAPSVVEEIQQTEAETKAVTAPAPAPAPMAVEAVEAVEAIEAVTAPPSLDETQAKAGAGAGVVEAPRKNLREVRPEEPKRRKGLARVIKRAAIDLPVAEPIRSGPVRPGPGSRPGPSRKPTGRPASAVAGTTTTTTTTTTTEAKGGDDKSGRKGKKKGKRTVQIQPETAEEKARRGGKAARKGSRKVEFSRGGGFDFQDRQLRMKGRKKQKLPPPVAETKAIKKRIKVFDTITVGDLAKRMGVKAGEVIAKLMGLGVLATMNQALDYDTSTVIAEDFGYEIEQGMTEELEIIQLQEKEEGGEEVFRPPVVTVMGHVDHGKTSILDAIRKTDVASGEAGGITQHIGAYHVKAGSGDVVFLDTPGHAAFTEMRSRGAKVTDIVVLVVAADDGVMEQTREAIHHAQAAEVPIVVAINKIDKDNADPARVTRELAEFGLVPEAWGGHTIYCECSAKQNIGIDELLDSIHLQAEMLELRADPNRKAKGRVVEAQLHKGRGPLATVLIQDGTLRVGEYFVVGQHYGKVRALTDDRGNQVESAGPAMPVEVQGLSGVPQAGDEFIVITDEKMARSVSASRQFKSREAELASASKVSLDNLFEKMAESEVMELRVVLRSDVQGTLEAFGQAAENLSTKAVKVRRLHEGTGAITESDIHLAAASDAIIIGFNIRPSVKVKELAEQEGVDVRTYDVIYHALEDIEKAMLGMLAPTFKERVIGNAEVRQVFSVPKVGAIAGSFVIDGKMERNAWVRVLRDSVVIYTGKIGSLRRFKDDAKEVLTGFECGIGVENFNDIKIGDVLEAFVLDKVEATL